MSKAEECRAKASWCEQMARNARDLAIKVELEQLAVEWRKLAKEIEESGSRVVACTLILQFPAFDVHLD